MADNRQKIRWAAQDRGIEALYHFTWGENLPSILEHGFLSREDLVEAELRHWYTDDARWDETAHAISFSIDSLNFSMFDAKRSDLRRGWIYLSVSREVLWTHSCRFCRVNASSREMRNNHKFLGGLWGFNTMFEDELEGFKEPQWRRVKNEIPDNLPTWNDAEVQILDQVNRSLIQRVYVGSERAKKDAETLIAKLNLSCAVEIDDYLAR